MDGKNENIILATASYDFDIKIWHAHNGVCARTFAHPDSVSILLQYLNELCYVMY